MTRDQLRALSLRLEAIDGHDSIKTIETNYARAGADNASGAFLCAYSAEATYGRHNCPFRRLDPIALWLHVHFSRMHGLSWSGCRTPDEVERRLDAGTLTVEHS